MSASIEDAGTALDTGVEMQSGESGGAISSPGEPASANRDHRRQSCSVPPVQQRSFSIPPSAGNKGAKSGRTSTETPAAPRVKKPSPAGRRRSPKSARSATPSPARRQETEAQGIFSAIDLGTNNCRLLIARPNRQGFRVIDAFSRIVRLGEGVADTGRLEEAAMERTIEALKICADKLQRRRVTCMRHVATEACRVANNTPVFLERVRAETGLNLEVISAAEEARLAVLGCQSLIAASSRYALVFDIGGGSTELIWVRMSRGRRVGVRGWISIPWGVVNLTEKFAPQQEDIAPAAYQAMIDAVRAHLIPFEARYNIRAVAGKHRVQLLGTSGTVTTLASLQLNLPHYIRQEVDGVWMRSADMLDLSRRVAAMPFAERADIACIGPDRARLVVAGCAILDAMLDLWPVPKLRVADRGIREGILRGMMEIGHPVSMQI